MWASPIRYNLGSPVTPRFTTVWCMARRVPNKLSHARHCGKRALQLAYILKIRENNDKSDTAQGRTARIEFLLNFVVIIVGTLGTHRND